MPRRNGPDTSMPSTAALRPASARELIGVQTLLRQTSPTPWCPGAGLYTVAGCFIAFPRGGTGRGAGGDPATAAVAFFCGGEVGTSVVITGAAGAPYEAGLLFLREGNLLEAVVRGLPELPDVLMVNGTGRDHPRRAGLAVHMGALLDIPTIGVTHRPLCALGSWPGEKKGKKSPLSLDGEVVGYWLRTRPGARPLAVHAGWRTSSETAVALVLASTGRVRTPEPVRMARRLARTARASHP